MKKLFVYMLVGAGVFASAAYADGYNPFHPLGGINSATTVPQVYSDGSTGTLAQIGQMADGSVQQTDANQPNGYAKLDANKNVVSPLLNNARVGGSDSGTDVSAAVANGVQIQDAVNECQQSVPNVFYGAVNSSSQMGVASNTEHLRASGNVLPYFNTAAIAAVVWGAGGATYDIGGPIGFSGFQNILKTTGVHGIFETSYNVGLTPDVSSAYYWNMYRTPADGGAVINEKDLLSQSGFQPTIAMLNMATDDSIGVVPNNDSGIFTDNDVQRFATAQRDIETNAPSVKHVWPWISGNNTHNFDASDPWWANGIKMMKMAGGVGLDMPAGLSVMNGPDSIAGMVAQIKWANANGIKTLILLSPYGEDTPPGYGTQITPQWRYDKDFAMHVKTLISWFVAADALPTAYAVVNYSPTHYYDPSTGAFHDDKCATCKVITANYMGADNDSVNQTVSYVARWVAENAPTSPYTSMPDMGTSLPSACATTVMGGYKTTKSVISTAQLGLGSLAYQDYNTAKLLYPSMFGAQVNGNFDFLGQNALSFGAGILPTPAMFGYVQSDTGSGLMVQNAPFIVNGFNLNITNGGNLALQGGNILAGNGGIEFSDATGNNVKWITGDGLGGINIGPYINVGNNISFKSDVIMNTSDILMNGTHGIQFQSDDKTVSDWITGDGLGGINIGPYINVGNNISFKSDVIMNTSDILMNGTHGIQFQSDDKTVSDWITGDGLGGLHIGSGITENANGSVTFSAPIKFNAAANFAQNGAFSGTRGLQFISSDGKSSTWLYGDGLGGLNVGSALNVSGSTVKLPTLTGTGNAYACIDASGNLYRSATACVSN
ncbi:hypothetical protein AZ09_10270 [Acetobacter aceti 1023]|nr:hypothetical protein AZ09_10270 [Acetobacter aceti 1023]